MYKIMLPLLLLNLSCFNAHKPDVEIAEQQRQPSSINKKLERFLYKKPIAVKTNDNLIESLNKKFGPPQHQEFALENFSKINDNKSPVYILFYQGFEIRVKPEDPMSNEYSLKSLVLHENVFKLPYGIKIGTNKSELKKVLGKIPAQENDNELVYCDSAPKNACVHFSIQDDLITRIVWN